MSNDKVIDIKNQGEEHHTAVFGIVIKKIIPFIEMRWFSFILSAAILLAGVVVYIYKGGFKLGIDFKGGTRIQVVINTPEMDIQHLRKTFNDAKMEADINTIGNPSEKIFMITVPVGENTTGKEAGELTSFLEKSYGVDKVSVRGSELVGPKMGKVFAERSLQLLLIASLLILIYVAVRFDFFYGTGAITSTLHDCLTMLAFAVFLDIPIDITVIAAILTILGYSINDTIVVFDRIRELHAINRDEDYAHIIDKSITQTLSRTIITSITVFTISFCMYVWGGQVLKNFALLLMIGILCGTYSSIFVASPITYMLRMAFDKRIKTVKAVKAVKAK